MEVYPAALLLLLVWLWVSIKDPDRSATVVIATLPFGMFAAVDAGGLSLLVPHLLAAVTLSLHMMRRAANSLGPFRLYMPAVLILAFAVYALFSATVLVRLFAGEFLVFPMSVDAAGIRISTDFLTTVKPVAPSNSNIAQSGYVLLSALVFLVFADISRRRGVRLIEAGLAWAAGLNVLLGVLDFAGMDALLAVVRTADYSLANEQTVLGLPRVIGGYSEPSAFGSASSVFFAYFAMSYLIGRKLRDGFLALGNLVFALLAFSSTGVASLFAAVFLIFLHNRHFLGRGITRTFAHWFVIGLSIALLALSIAAITTPLLERSSGILDELFLQKSTSQSGLERAAWARYGFHAFFETWGMGAGVGSLRANGLASVLLGSVGIPGTLLLVMFMWSAFGRAALPPRSEELRSFAASRVGALTMMSGQLLSGTTPDPELMMMSLAVVASTLKLGGRQVPVAGSAAAHLAPGGNMVRRPEGYSDAN